MSETESILQAYQIAVEAGKKTALATVVHVEGSSYRRPGARMLITENGEFTGSISGGCLEGDALRKAMHAINSEKIMLVTYDTSDEDDAKFGLGLGCNGIIQVLIEPLQGNDGLRVIKLLRSAHESRQTAAIVTLFSLHDRKGPQHGSCFILKENGDEGGDIPYLQKESIISEAKQVIKHGKSSFKKYEINEREIIAFTEVILSPVSLVILGAGNDVMPLVKIADILGWQTTVVDGRPMYADKNRFPTSSCQVLLAKADEVLQHITIDSRTVFVLMTHNYNYDMAMLKALLERQVIYIGMLGPKKKLNLMFEELEEAGMYLSPEQRQVIHSPVGLNIGAETSEEIALSIAAEIKSVLTSNTPGYLREKEDAIHQPVTIKTDKR